MKKDWTIKIGMLIIIVLLALNLFMPVQSVRSAQKYQYKVIRVTGDGIDQKGKNIETQLNMDANEGWELVLYDANLGSMILKK